MLAPSFYFNSISRFFRADFPQRTAVVLVFAAALLSGVSVGCRKKVKIKDVVTIENVELDEKPTLAIFNQYGPVQIIGGRALPRALWGKVVREASGYGQAAAEKNLEKIEVNSTKTGDMVTMRVTAPNARDYKAELQVKVPVEANIKVVGKDGDVSVMGVSGDIEVENESGEIILRGMNGSVRINSKKGNITISGVVKSLDVESETGTVHATIRQGEKLSRDSVIRSRSGNITVRISENLDANVNLHSGSGRITANFPLKKEPNGRAVGTLGGGGNMLLVEALGGKVDVLRLPMKHHKPFEAKGLPPVRGGGPHERPLQKTPGHQHELPEDVFEKPKSYDPKWPAGHEDCGHDHDHGHQHKHHQKHDHKRKK